MRTPALSVVAVLVLAAAGCGKVVSSKSVLATAEIGAEGGTLFLGALRIEIPPDALVEPTTVRIQLVADPPAGNVGPAYQVDAGGAELQLPATLFYTAEAADLSGETKVGELRLAWVEDGAWKELPGCLVDAKTGVVQGQTMHFSIWGVIPPLPPIPCSAAKDCPEMECMVAGCEKGGCAYSADPACGATDVSDGQDQEDAMDVADMQDQDGATDVPDMQDQDGATDVPDMQDQNDVPDVPDAQDQEGAEASDGVCTPDCAGKVCGDDGCGGGCGGCAGPNDLCVEGQCVCVPDCEGKQCGDDGCGGGCGTCGAGTSCVADACVAYPPCSVWDYITEEELDAAGQCIQDTFGYWGMYPALFGQGHLFEEELLFDGDFFTGITEANDKKITLTVPCTLGMKVVIWAEKPFVGLEQGGYYDVTDPACLADGSCKCDPCIFAQASVEGKPALDAVSGQVMFGCNSNKDFCGVFTWCWRAAKLAFSDVKGEKQLLDIHCDGPDFLSKDKWIDSVTKPPCGPEICDGLDNDCDGKVDEGPWEAETCDGLDNDCDGLTDEELDEKKAWKESGACSTAGVCGSPDLQATCKGAFGWECHYSLLAPWGWEADEKTCDGQDNDCDGATDELACGYCEPCNDFTNCQSGACLETPLGDKLCSLGKNYCVYVDPFDGPCATVPAKTGKGCKDTTQPCLCGGGEGGADAFWFCDGVPACSGATPFCYEGECKTCIPGEKKCDGSTILECSTDGKAWTVYGVCGAGFICLCDGKCLVNDEFKVNVKAVATLPGDYNPKVAGLAGGGFVVVYPADKPIGGALTDVLARLFDCTGKALTSEFIVNLPGVAGYQENPDVASFPNADGGFVVVWDSSADDGDGWGIVGQRFLNNGLKQGEKFVVNANVAMDQRAPEVATLYDGSFLVTWEHSFAGADSPDIRAQLFDGNAAKMGPEKTLNSYVAGQQRTPVVAALDKEGWIAAWASLGQVDNNDVIARRYSLAMVELSFDMQANLFTLSAQKRPAIGGLLGTHQGEFVVAWESYGQDTPTTQGVFAQVFTKNGQAKQPVDILCNSKYVAGNQKDPELAVLEDSSFVGAWESSDVDGDGDAVLARVFDATGKALMEDEIVVNQTVVGQQQNPAVASLGGSVYVVVWTNLANSTHDIYGRLFQTP